MPLLWQFINIAPEKLQLINQKINNFLAVWVNCGIRPPHLFDDILYTYGHRWIWKLSDLLLQPPIYFFADFLWKHFCKNCAASYAVKNHFNGDKYLSKVSKAEIWNWFFKMGQLGPLFAYFHSFSNTNFSETTVGVGWIRTYGTDWSFVETFRWNRSTKPT